MSKRAILRLDGTLETGFRVTLEVGSEGNLHGAEEEGHLPPSPNLIQSLATWQHSYAQLSGDPLFGNTRAIKFQTVSVQTNLPTQIETCRQAAIALQAEFKRWLASGSFQLIDLQLREAINRTDTVRMVLRTGDKRLHLLPWHSWEFIDRYAAELAFYLSLRGTTDLGRSASRSRRASKKVRILAILGHRDGIDTDTDHQMLKALPNAEVTFLVEPQRQAIDDQLWEQSWDMLFFAGHSLTEDESGRIYINPDDSLTIEDLKYGVRRAIAHGLQLAIFNSCDGLGLVYELEPLGLPQLIVMRQPVPDRVAHLFLKNLLSSFVQGEGLYLAVRTARERLQSLENHYPCASWLPVIFQHSTQPTLTWDGLRGRSPFPPPSTFPSPQFLRPPKLKLRHAVLITLAVTGLVLGARSQGWLRAAELWTYDQFMKQQVRTAPDPRLLVVGVNDADMKTYGETLSDRTVYQLLTKLEKHQPKVIGLDILRDQPQGGGWQDLIQLLQTSDRVVAICQDASDRQIPIAPPPQLPQDRIGYADTLIYDSDDVIRRYVMVQAVKGESSCSTPQSLTFQVIRRFLPENTSYRLQPGVGISINNEALEIVQANSGGYQLSSQDILGYQLLIDYRPKHLAQIASLTDILNAQDSDLQDWVRDRIVLIGYMGKNSGDNHLTPLGNQAGVMIHAYIVSQVLNTVMERNSPLSPWSKPVEAFWIVGWSAIASLIVWKFQSERVLFILLGAVLIVLVGSSFVLFQQSIWVPVIPASFALLLSSCVAIYFTTKFPTNSL
jgi:CHASE2 domain-containing sensor protein